MKDGAQGVHAVAVDQHVHAHHVGGAVFLELVVHRGIAAGHRLHAVEEVEHDLGERQLVGEVHLAAVVGKVRLDAALVLAELHDGAHVFVGYEDRDRVDRLADLVDLVDGRELGRVLDVHHRAVRLQNLVHHGRGRRDEVHVVFAFKALLDDVHVQEAEEAGAEAEAERLRDFGLELERGVVELELREGVAKRIVLVGLDGIEAREHLRLHFLEAGHGLVGRILGARHGVAHASVLELLDAGNHEAHFTRGERGAALGLRREDAELLDEMIGAGGHQADLVLRTERAVDDAHEHHHADVVVEPGVDDEGLELGVRIALRRRNVAYDALKDVVDAHAGLGRAGNRVRRVDADHVLDFLGGRIGVRALKVHLVEDGEHGHAEVDGGVAVRNRLGLDALRSVDDEQRAFARGERTAHFIGEVDVPRSVDEVEFVDLAVLGLVLEGGGLRLDRDAAFTLEVHAVEHLGAHFAVGKTAAALDQAVGERRLAVVNVGDDREVADFLH